MSPTNIRRQVYELTPDDLSVYSVWEFALDEEGVEGQDEATVRPFVAGVPVNPHQGMLIARATFTLADGTQVKGYISAPFQGEIELRSVQPTAVLNEGQVSFWCGRFVPTPEHIASCYARLGKRLPGEVFPLKFVCDVSFGHGPMAGEVPGFVIIEDLRSRRTKVLV